MNIKTIVSVILVLSLGAAGFWWKGHQPQPMTTERLLVRAHEYWEAMRLNDQYTQYQMQAARAVGQLTPDEFDPILDFNARVMSYTLGEASINGDRAQVGIEIYLTMPDFKGKTFKGATSQDDWTYIKGDWYHGWIEDDETGKSKEKPSESAVPSV